MKYFSNINEIQNIEKAIVTVGNFDGVHRGHKAIIDKMRSIKNDGNIVVVSFSPHPKSVLYDENIKFIQSPSRKANILARYGTDYLVNIPFTKDFAKLSPEEFINNYLIQKLHSEAIVVGYDCHFSRNHNQTVEALEKLKTAGKYDLIIIPPVYNDDKIISSTEIRNNLQRGNIRIANEMLGYEYSIYGKVVYGQQIGRTLGFPTANVSIDEDLMLVAANGVYACKIKVNNENYFGMCNVGYRPTLKGKDLTIEANIFNFDKDIYDEYIGVYFVDRLRDEIPFANIEELKKQLTQDVNTACERLGGL